MGEKTYTLEGLTETHLRSIMKALDFTSRIGMGQYRELFDLVDPSFKVRGPERDEAEKLLLRARSLMMPRLESSSSYWSIRSPEVPEHHRVGFDIQQVIRHRLAWDRNPKGDFMVDFDTPWQTAESVGLVKIRVEKPIEEEPSQQLPPPPAEVIVEMDKPRRKTSSKKTATTKSKKPTAKKTPPKKTSAKKAAPAKKPSRKA